MIDVHRKGNANVYSRGGGLLGRLRCCQIGSDRPNLFGIDAPSRFRPVTLCVNVHRVAVSSNLFSKSPKPTLGRKRYTGCAVPRTFHWYFFSYALANFSNSACGMPITSTVP